MRGSRIIIPAICLAAGLAIGLGIGGVRIKKEEQIFQGKIKEANRKIAFMQKKTAEEKTDAATFIEEQCQNNLNRLEDEKKALAGELGTIKGQMQKTEAKAREADELLSNTRKDLQAAQQSKNALSQQLEKSMQGVQALREEMKKSEGEKQTAQAGLKKTTQDIERCKADNARLCIIAQDILNRYRRKGLGAVLMGAEPLTQIKKVELEELINKYQDEIEKQKIKNNTGVKNVN